MNCNWKVVNDGFSETYHVQGLHREMLASIDDVNTPQRIFQSPQRVLPGLRLVPSPRLGRDVDEQAVWDAFVVTRQGWAHGTGAQSSPAPSSRCARRYLRPSKT